MTGFDVEVLLLACKAGYRVAEVPVEWHYGADTKVNPLRDPLRMFKDILRLKINDWRGVYR